jgi:hypothetical protein
MICLNDQINHNINYFTSIPEELTDTDNEFVYIRWHSLLADCLLLQQSESTPNTSFGDINASATDTVVNNKNMVLDDQAILPEDNIDQLLTNEQVCLLLMLLVLLLWLDFLC